MALRLGLVIPVAVSVALFGCSKDSNNPEVSDQDTETTIIPSEFSARASRLGFSDGSQQYYFNYFELGTPSSLCSGFADGQSACSVYQNRSQTVSGTETILAWQDNKPKLISFDSVDVTLDIDGNHWQADYTYGLAGEQVYSKSTMRNFVSSQTFALQDKVILGSDLCLVSGVNCDKFELNSAGVFGHGAKLAHVYYEVLESRYSPLYNSTQTVNDCAADCSPASEITFSGRVAGIVGYGRSNLELDLVTGEIFSDGAKLATLEVTKGLYNGINGYQIATNDITPIVYLLVGHVNNANNSVEWYEMYDAEVRLTNTGSPNIYLNAAALTDIKAGLANITLK